MDRKQIYAALAMAKKKACMDEDTYRLLLAKHGAKENDKGKISAKSMTDDQLSAALDDLNRKPRFYPKWQPDFKKRIFTGPRSRKLAMLVAIWTDLYNAGALTECRSLQYAVDTAFDAWADHYFGIDGAITKADFLSEQRLDGAIKALKGWYERILNQKDSERQAISDSIGSREIAILENRETSCPRQSRTT